MNTSGGTEGNSTHGAVHFFFLAELGLQPGLYTIGIQNNLLGVASRESKKAPISSGTLSPIPQEDYF